MDFGNKFYLVEAVVIRLSMAETLQQQLDMMRDLVVRVGKDPSADPSTWPECGRWATVTADEPDSARTVTLACGGSSPERLVGGAVELRKDPPGATGFGFGELSFWTWGYKGEGRMNIQTKLLK